MGTLSYTPPSTPKQPAKQTLGTKAKKPQKALVWPILPTPRRCPTATERPMERAGEPRLSSRRSSVEAKMHRTSWKVRKSSTVTACPVVVSLCSWNGGKNVSCGRRGLGTGLEMWRGHPETWVLLIFPYFF